jgi:ATP-dependent protease HslVU (ClpYQ) ATPase subunit
MVRREKRDEVRAAAERNVEEQILDLLLPPRPHQPEGDPAAESFRATRE